MDDILSDLLRETITNLAFVHNYGGFDYESVSIGTSAGRWYKFYADEIDRGGNEAFSLVAEACTDPGADAEVFQYDLSIRRIELLKRDEWTEPSEPFEGMIGNNPRSQEHARVGGAPPTAVDVITVTSAVIAYSVSSDKRIMIYAAEFPLLVGFTRDDQEIEESRNACTIHEFVYRPDIV